jgi:tRNA G18 (ribose-2'-O)-methylase SpoU
MTFIVSETQLKNSSTKARHKVALKLLQKALEGHYASLQDYRYVEDLLGLASVDLVDTKKMADRLHFHRIEACQNLSESNLPFQILHQDVESKTPFLDVHVVLNQLRSAFNVGSILRTTEALRLGSLYFEGITPKSDNSKVMKTSMGCHDKVKCFDLNDKTSLPRPIIGLETAKNAASIYEYKFPETFTLILGNEEYGISDEWLKECDVIVTIPMYGFKNSLNVASAFAITAHEIRKQHALKSL